MIILPSFLTFTGADDWTDVAEMAALSALYPIEWGILFSPDRQGKSPRFPANHERIAGQLAGLNGVRLAAHLCGAHSRRIMADEPQEPINLMHYGRIQINHGSPVVKRIMAFRDDPEHGVHIDCIAQCRGLFPPPDISWLFDTSGGRGLRPRDEWPPYPGHMVGYAGGIGADNVRSIIREIGATGPYWLDMESNVRTDDRFDLVKVRTVCEVVYGKQTLFNGQPIWSGQFDLTDCTAGHSVLYTGLQMEKCQQVFGPGWQLKPAEFQITWKNTGDDVKCQQIIERAAAEADRWGDIGKSIGAVIRGMRIEPDND